VSDWNSGPPLAFVVDLGDIIDQQCEALGQSRSDLDTVLAEFARVRAPVHHIIGNHELYNFNRRECAELIPNITPWYRSWRPANGWRMIILDPYELNVIERGESESLEEAFEYLGRNNPNDVRAPRGTVDFAGGLHGLDRRFTPMGGGFRKEQLAWLGEQLAEAEDAGDRVMVFTHLPVMPESTVPGALAWNYDEALAVLRRASPGTVALVLAGHFHEGGHAQDSSSGTHHVTLPSPLLAPASDLRAHCTVEAFADRLEIRGKSLVPSRTLSLPLRPSRPAPPDARARL